MTDTLARMRQIIGSTGEWSAHNLVLGDGEVALERINAETIMAKVGDGTQPFSEAPYLVGAANIPPAVRFKGTTDPTAAPPTAVAGDAWAAVPGGVIAASWGAPVAGETAQEGDLLVRTDTGTWALIPKAASDPTQIGLFTGASALVIPAGSDLIRTTGYDTIGKGAALYVADAAVDAAWVAANPRSSFISANARGFRLSGGQPITVMMLGAKGDNVADDLAAFQAGLAAVKALGSAESANYRRVPSLHVPLVPTAYYLSDTIELLDATYHILADSPAGAQNGGWSVRLRFAPGKTGFRIQSYNTQGETTRADGIGAIGTVLENLAIYTDGAGGSTTADGFRLRATASLINCSAWNFPRHGCNVTATAGGGGAVEGNANLFLIAGGNYWRNGGCGIFIDGADVNAGVIEHANVTGNGTWGIWDSSFLGNTIIGAHADGNGVKTEAGTFYAPNTATSMVTHSGERYAVIPGQETGASTNAPSGTNANNTWWRWVGTGGVHPIFPTWSSGIAVQSGGAYRCDDVNARSVFVGCYSEGTQAPSALGPTAMAISGLHGAGLVGPHLDAAVGNLISRTGIGSQARVGSEVTQINLGAATPDASVLAEFGRTTTGANEWRWKITADQTWYFDYLGSAALQPFQVTGPGTTQQFGRGAAQPYKLYAPEVFFGSGADARGISYAAAAPTAGAHGQGEVVFNSAPTAGGIIAWVCTTAGTPGTWTPLTSAVNTQGVGYMTGAGGDVTQTGDKGQPVTLNTLSGRIVMNNAALAANTSVGFNLMNSTITAQDVVLLVIGGGIAVNSYLYGVDFIAAGSAHIHLRNITAGPLSDAVAFNFAVIKAKRT